MVCSLVSTYFDSPQLGINKNKLYKTLGYWSRDMLNFVFLSPPHFMHHFPRKMLLMVHSINWPNFTVWLPLLLEILGNVCITIVCWLGYDVINFETNLIIPIKPFFIWPKNQKKNLNIFITKRVFKVKFQFSSFLKGFQLSKIVSGLKVRL